MPTWRDLLPDARHAIRSRTHRGERFVCRDQVLLALLAAGVKPSDLESLDKSGMQVLGSDRVEVTRGTTVSYPLRSEQDAATLRAYLQALPSGAKLFVSEQGGVLRSRTIRQRVSVWAARHQKK